jgi:hypothetical protein
MNSTIPAITLQIIIIQLRNDCTHNTMCLKIRKATGETYQRKQMHD